METKIKKCVYNDDMNEINVLLNSGLDPDYEGGWPIRLAARYGSYTVVKTLIQYGANPHLLGDAGASTLQLAVFSGAHWDANNWTFLLSYCDSSQLADGAAVAIIFNNIPALKRILETGRCNTNIPTTLTGKTVEDLAKGYKLQYMLNVQENQSHRNVTPVCSPRLSRPSRSDTANTLTPQAHHSRNLSPSVARFFHLTARQSGLSPPHANMVTYSPTTQLG